MDQADQLLIDIVIVFKQLIAHQNYERDFNIEEELNRLGLEIDRATEYLLSKENNKDI